MRLRDEEEQVEKRDSCRETFNLRGERMEPIRLVIARLPGKAPLCLPENVLLEMELDFPKEVINDTVMATEKRKPKDINEAIGVLGGNAMRYQIRLKGEGLTGLDEVEVEGRLWLVSEETGLPERHPERYRPSLAFQHIAVEGWDLQDKEGKPVPFTFHDLLSLESPIPGTIIELVLRAVGGGVVDFDAYFPIAR